MNWINYVLINNFGNTICLPYRKRFLNYINWISRNISFLIYFPFLYIFGFLVYLPLLKIMSCQTGYLKLLSNNYRKIWINININKENFNYCIYKNIYLLLFLYSWGRYFLFYIRPSSAYNIFSKWWRWERRALIHYPKCFQLNLRNHKQIYKKKRNLWKFANEIKKQRII